MAMAALRGIFESNALPLNRKPLCDETALEDGHYNSIDLTEILRLETMTDPTTRLFSSESPTSQKMGDGKCTKRSDLYWPQEEQDEAEEEHREENIDDEKLTENGDTCGARSVGQSFSSNTTCEPAGSGIYSNASFTCIGQSFTSNSSLEPLGRGFISHCSIEHAGEPAYVIWSETSCRFGVAHTLANTGDVDWKSMQPITVPTRLQNDYMACVTGPTATRRVAAQRGRRKSRSFLTQVQRAQERDQKLVFMPCEVEQTPVEGPPMKLTNARRRKEKSLISVAQNLLHPSNPSDGRTSSAVPREELAASAEAVRKLLAARAQENECNAAV